MPLFDEKVAADKFQRKWNFHWKGFSVVFHKFPRSDPALSLLFLHVCSQGVNAQVCGGLRQLVIKVVDLNQMKLFYFHTLGKVSKTPVTEIVR